MNEHHTRCVYVHDTRWGTRKTQWVIRLVRKKTIIIIIIKTPGGTLHCSALVVPAVRAGWLAYFFLRDTYNIISSA